MASLASYFPRASDPGKRRGQCDQPGVKARSNRYVIMGFRGGPPPGPMISKGLGVADWGRLLPLNSVVCARVGVPAPDRLGLAIHQSGSSSFADSGTSEAAVAVDQASQS